MNLPFDSIYSKIVAANEKSIHGWETYLKSLKALDLNLFSDKLVVPILVPLGSRILFRGNLKHTNEITVSMGADYFAKCSLKQAEIIRQHRIKNAQSKVDLYIKEKEYLENHVSFSKQNVYDAEGQEIVEVYSEKEDTLWRKKHRENIKKYKKQSKIKKENKDKITDEELWNKLEELELQEELENELVQDDNKTLSKINSEFVKNQVDINDNKSELCANIGNSKKPATISKLDLFQQVIVRQNELGEKLEAMRQRENTKIITEKNLISKLDEMEQLDELEDEMDRLDDIIKSANVEDVEEDKKNTPTIKTKRRVSFADENESETLEITFKHSEVDPSPEPYDPEKGIHKPSDVYIAYEKFFTEDTTSILKKSKYGKVTKIPNTVNIEPKEEMNQINDNFKSTVVVKNVVERVNKNAQIVGNTDARPTSLFKKKRMQSKC